MKTPSILPFNPKKIISLWDMIMSDLAQVRYYLNKLECYQVLCQMICGDKEPYKKFPNFELAELLSTATKTPTGNKSVSKKDLFRFRLLFERLWPLCEKYKLKNSEREIRRLDDLCEAAQCKSSLTRESCTYLELSQLLDVLYDVLRFELREIKFVAVLPTKEQFFEQDNLFGEHFHKKASDEINADIKAAGNCLALDLNTAAVFHAIRAAERGMRRLASRLKVLVERDGMRMKIADATWDELIKGVTKRIETEKLKPKSERKLKGNFRDYEILAGQFNRLKDDRNEVMHTHDDFKASEALGVFERVRDFMQRLAKRISLK
jgi:hypothetical protein